MLMGDSIKSIFFVPGTIKQQKGVKHRPDKEKMVIVNHYLSTRSSTKTADHFKISSSTVLAYVREHEKGLIQ